MAEADAAGGSRRGRPALDPQKRTAMILDALERVVAEHGLRAASMAAVARAAGISKRTLYAAHPNRDALIEAWVGRLRASLVRPLPPEARGLPLAERLRRLLGRETQLGGDERRLAALRAIITEAPGNPGLAEAFRRAGPAAARAIVAQELKRADAAGEIAVEDPDAASTLLCDMAWPSLIDRLLDAPSQPLDPRLADARLALAIRVFLRGVGCAGGGDP